MDARTRRRIQNQKEQESKSGVLDFLLKTGGAVAGLGATTALLSRSSLGGKLNDTLNKTTKFLKAMENKDIPSWNRMTISDFRKARSSASEVWRNTKKTLDETPYIFDYSRNNYFSFLAKTGSMENIGSRHQYRQIYNEKLRDKTQRAMIKAYGDEAKTRKATGLISSIIDNRNDINVHRTYAKRHGVSEQFMQDAYDFVHNELNKQHAPTSSGSQVSQMAKDSERYRSQVFSPLMKKITGDYKAQLKYYGDAREKKTGVAGLIEQTKDWVSNTRAGTIRDVIEMSGDEKFRGKFHYSRIGEDGKTNESVDIIAEIKETARRLKESDEEAYQDFLNIVPDKNGFRISGTGKNKHIVSGQGMQDIANGIEDFVASTLPGKILKLRDIQYARKAPSVFFWAKDELQPILAAKVNDERNKNNRELDKSVFYSLGKYYGITENEAGDFAYKELTGLENTYLQGKFGTTQRLVRSMMGDTASANLGGIAGTLDVFQDRSVFKGRNPIEFLAGFLGGDDEKALHNSARDLLYQNLNYKEKTANYRLRSFSASPEIAREANEFAFDEVNRYYSLSDAMSDFISNMSSDSASAILERMDQINAANGQHEYSIQAMVARKNAESLLKALSIEDEHLFRENIQNTLASYDHSKNPELLKLYNRLLKDAPGSANTISRERNLAREMIGTNVEDLDIEDRTRTFFGNIRKEASKEALLQLGDAYKEVYSQAVREPYSGYQTSLDILSEIELTQSEAKNAKRLVHSGAFDEITGSKIPITDHLSFEQQNDFYWQRLNEINLNMNIDDEYVNSMKEEINKVANENKNIFRHTYEGTGEVYDPVDEPYSDWIVMNKATSPLDLIKSLNDFTKAKATAKSFFGQFAAGRNNPGEITTATLGPYFMLERLSEELNTVGLGFSAQSTGSTYELAKNFALKRILPVGLAYNYYDYLDDVSQDITGTSISGALAGGLMNVDLAFRRTSDALGLTDWLKNEKAINPIMQYWGGHEDYMDYDERVDWYQNGYDPVRKGAWWTFGSVNEARGAEIQYWEPTYVRRIQSDYKDKSLYDDTSDKWSHSWLPTPTNPLSPLFALANPYYLEEKHMDDRPYPVTGHLFEDNTPWGAILNPTLGEIIKPQKDLHTFMGFHYREMNGVDPLSVIHAINLEIKQKARDLGSRNYIKVSGDDYQPVSFSSYNAPTEDSAVMSAVLQNGELTYYNDGSNYETYRPGAGGALNNDYGVLYGGSGSTYSNNLNGVGAAGSAGVISASSSKASEAIAALDDQSHISLKQGAIGYLTGDYTSAYRDQVVINKDGKVGITKSTRTRDEIDEGRNIRLADRISIDKQVNGDIMGFKGAAIDLLNKYDPRRIIGGINQYTKEQARIDKVISPNAFDDDQGMIFGQSVRSMRPANAMELINDPDQVMELIHAGKGKDLVTETATSWRLISGIYGYMAGEAFGIGVDQQKRIATGQDIDSNSRAFWDMGIGGAGGSLMEIARRFIPDFRRNTRINNLLNTMPDWMPDRFRYGDPYTLLPKGEMRLPGRGYESLNDLHPDAYGHYGAFDRYKILSDIAPYSPEYKLWKKIAEKTVVDPQLIQEMEEISERRNQQIKKHDFYEYNTLGKGVDYRDVVVTKVLDHGKFLSGNVVYKVAGVNVKGNEQENAQQVLGRYLHVGQSVTVAMDSDFYGRENKDVSSSTDVAVFIDGENISDQMLEAGDATKRKGDSSNVANYAKYGPMQKLVSGVSELIAHADVPWLSDQYLRVRTPLESYQAEQVYGTPYQTWAHPIDSFIKPALEKAVWARDWWNGPLTTLLDDMHDKEGGSATSSFLNRGIWLLSNRGAFVGAATTFIVTQRSDLAIKAGHMSSAAVGLAHILTGGRNYFDQGASGAVLGSEIARVLEKNKYVGAVLGAAAAMGWRVASGQTGKQWIPERTKKRWEVEEYFDRLTYVKYMGLYKAAAEKAKDEEGVDIEDILEIAEMRDEKNAEALGDFKNLKKLLSRKARANEEKDRLTGLLNSKIKGVSDESMLLPGGEWARTALLYKKAAEATMFAIDEKSSWEDIIRALPTNDKEYFIEFVKERNPKKRKEILEFASPALSRALMYSWGKGEQVPEQESNESFFQRHDLPDAGWEGWKPQIDLKDVEIKTIENEAMNLADFGFYESSLREPSVQGINPINMRASKRDNSASAIKKHLRQALEGRGLKNVDISVNPGPSGGMSSIVAAIGTMISPRNYWNQANMQFQSEM